MRKSIFAAIASIFLISLCLAAEPDLAGRAPTNIPAQPLAQALSALAKQRKFEVLYRSDLVRGLRTRGATGELTAAEALVQLLRGTSLSYKFLSDNTVTITPSSGGTVSAKDRPTRSSSADPGQDPGSAPGREESTNSSNSDQDQGSAEPRAGQGGQGRKAATLEEVVVTAQKRKERLLDVPVSVTTLNSGTLTATDNVRLQDYFAQVPGLDFEQGNRGETFLAIRGITAGAFGNPTVGIVVDGVPYGSSVSNVALGTVPDIDPGDLANVEVLRGPQGTLYGANSMGGLINYVTVDPSTAALSGNVQVGASGVQNSGQTGDNFRGSVNVPLSDDLAVRMSAFDREDPGYIDDVEGGARDVNSAHVRGAYVSALWRPTDQLSVKLSGLYQNHQVHGAPIVTVGLGDLQQSTLPGTGYRYEDLGAFAATINYSIGKAVLTSITGFNKNSISDSGDITQFLGGLSQTDFGADAPGAALVEHVQSKKFSQELRLSVPVTETIDWLLGLFYTHEASGTAQEITGDTLSGAVAGEFLSYHSPLTYSERAVFTDLTFHLTDRFDVQVGGRESFMDQTVSAVDIGPLVGGTSVTPSAGSTQNAFTYLLTPRFKVSPDLMIYVRLASGYRPGGPNTAHTAAASIPSSYAPDTTKDYEIGAKGNVIDGRLDFDTDLFYIDWRDMQLSLTDTATALSYEGNAGAAKSEGVEFTLQAKPWTGMTVTTSGAVTNAVLTSAFPAATGSVGMPGDRLPYSSKFSGSFGLEQAFPLTSTVVGTVGGELMDVGWRDGEFTDSVNRVALPGYTRLDFHFSFEYQGWQASVFANNVTDRRGILTAYLGIYPAQSYTVIAPRTIGINLSRSF